jgi:hypothetical protein
MKAMVVMGHGGNTIARMPDAAKGIENEIPGPLF